MALVKVGDRFWIAKTRTEVETQFGNADDFPKDSIVRIATGADAGDYYWDPTSAATAGAGVIAVPGETGRFLLGASTSSTPSVSSSAAGSAAAFPAGSRRIFHSDGTAAGGTWSQLTSTDVTGAFAAGAIGAGILTAGTNGQVLTTAGGVATWAAPALVNDDGNGAVTDFPPGERRILHSDGSTAGGTWDQLTSTDVTGAFANGSIPAAKLAVGAGTEGQVVKIVSGVPTFADESGTGASPVTASVSGTVNAFTSGQRRIFHSDGTTAGGVWTQLSSTDVTGAFAAGAIGASIITAGSNGQVLTTSGGVATWAAPATTALVGSATAGTANQFPAGSRRIFHSDGTTAGGTWDQLTSTDVTGAFAAGAIGAGIITAGSNGQVLTTSGGVATWATPSTTPLVTGSVAGTSNAFTPSVRRIFHSDGTTAGGTWAQLAEVDVTGAFAASSIPANIVKPGTAGQVLTTSGGVATWATPAAPAFVTSSAAGTAASFPASSLRIFHSDGTSAGGVWTQLTSTDVTGAFADASIPLAKIVPGSSGQQLTIVGGVPTWSNPEISITGAVNGDIIRREAGAWQRYALLNNANAPLMSISGLPTWSPLNTAPTVTLTATTSTNKPVDLTGYGDNRVVYLDATLNAGLISINETGFRHGPYLFINASDFNITIHADSTAINAGFITPTGQNIVLQPGWAMLAHYYGDGSIRDFFVMQVFNDSGHAQLSVPGSIGEILYHNGTEWARLPPAAATDYKLMSGGPSGAPSWVQDDDGATVILRPGYSGTARNTFGTWADAFNAAKAHGGPAKILIESTGTSLTIPAGTWDGDARIGVYFSSRGGALNITIATGAELQNLTAWESITSWPFATFEVVISVSGTSTNGCAIYQGGAAGTTLRYCGRFAWTGTRSAIRTIADAPVYMRETQHVGTPGIVSSGDLYLVAEHRVVAPVCTSDSGTATLRVRQMVGTSLANETFSWNGSGGVILEKPDNVEATSYTSANSAHWPEGNPTNPKDALDKLAARDVTPVGANLFHNLWLSFGMNTEGLDVNTSAESLTLWVPQYNHWLLLGFLSTNTTTDHRDLRVGFSRTTRNMVHSGFWDFVSGDGISSNFKRPLSAVVIPNGSGVRVVVSAALVSASANCVATSDNGGETWTLRTGHFGSGTNGYSAGLVYTGTHLIGATTTTNSSVGRSTNGVTWSSVTVSSATRVKLVTDGAGAVLAFTASGAYDRSGNHGSSWTTGSISGFGTLHDAIWFNGKFVVMSTAGTVWTSPDGNTWSSPTSIAIKHPGKSGFLPYGYAYRSLVKCGGVLACLFKGVYDLNGAENVEIFYSYDGINWEDGSVMRGVVDGTMATSSTRFAIHLASSSPNGASDAATSVHQIMCRVPGMGYDEFGVGSYWAASPAVQNAALMG